MTKEVTLRLRIRHYSYEVADEYIGEVKLSEAHGFWAVGLCAGVTMGRSCYDAALTMRLPL